MSLYTDLMEKLEGHKYAGYFTALCPFHTDHSPSFFVWEDSGRYYCKSCEAKGSLEYLNKYLGGKAVKVSRSVGQVLPRWSDWERKFGSLTDIAYAAHDAIKRFKNHLWYFQDRKIDQFFELGMFGYLDGWALFPVKDSQGKIQNIVVRHTKNPNTRYAIRRLEGNPPMLYAPNWDRVQQSEYVYVPYGIVDSWAFESLSLASVTGITGKSLSAELLKPLGKRFIIVPDDNEEKDAHILANKLGWRAKVKSIRYPDGVKDPDGIRRVLGNTTLLQMIGV